MSKEIKFRFHFINAAPVVLTLNELMWGDVIRNICYRGDAGSITHQCQYTGFTDRNGKEIYEGDVVRYEWSRGKTKSGISIAKVIWRDTMWTLSNNQTKWQDHVLLKLTKALEVIGNIYQNAEALIPPHE